jgi:hypothetical protein
MQFGIKSEGSLLHIYNSFNHVAGQHAMQFAVFDRLRNDYHIKDCYLLIAKIRIFRDMGNKFG